MSTNGRTPARSLRVGAVLAAVSVAVVGLAGPAGAHVTVDATTTAAGAYTVLTVSVPHGCDGSATTEVTISIPEEVNAVTPTRNALWQVEKQTETLEPPVTDSHGSTITERVASVTYRADTPLPEGFRDAFELSLRLPEAEGTTLAFPTVQTCEEGESAWIEVPEDGQDADDLAQPAPAITVTAAEGDGHGAPASSTGSDPVRVGSEDGTDPWTVGALVAGLLGAALGAAALLLQRRRG